MESNPGNGANTCDSNSHPQFFSRTLGQVSRKSPKNVDSESIHLLTGISDRHSRWVCKRLTLRANYIASFFRHGGSRKARVLPFPGAVFVVQN